MAAPSHLEFPMPNPARKRICSSWRQRHVPIESRIGSGTTDASDRVGARPAHCVPDRRSPGAPRKEAWRRSGCRLPPSTTDGHQGTKKERRS